MIQHQESKQSPHLSKETQTNETNHPSKEKIAFYNNEHEKE